MIAVEEARRILLLHTPVLGEEEIALRDALDRCMASTVHAPHDHPLFDNSAVDGYAFAHGPDAWTVVGAVAAGEVFPRALHPDECVRIFTGAAVPAGADTVVMQEFAQRDGDRLRHTDQGLCAGGNVRRKGEQVRAGDAVLTKGHPLNPAALGLLASIGVRTVRVARRPRVGVVVTGGEFMVQGDGIPGRIFSSNDLLLASALEQQRVPCIVGHAVDDGALLRAAIERALINAEAVITTGGASVGDHDLVHAVLQDLGAVVHFHGVAQKPGKPMLFATLDGKPFLGLPGNPRAVMVLFHEYVRPLLNAMQGAKEPGPRVDHLLLTHAVQAKGDRAEFRAAAVKGGRVTLLADEGSHMLRSLVDADALAYLPVGRRAWQAGDPIDVHPFSP